jgi:hypothetical protein
MAGHCYVAAQAVYHLLGGRRSGWTPHSGPGGAQGAHWWLQHGGQVLDPTADQYPAYDYAQGRGRGFLTAQPSRRAQVVLERVRGR